MYYQQQTRDWMISGVFYLECRWNNKLSRAGWNATEFLPDRVLLPLISSDVGLLLQNPLIAVDGVSNEACAPWMCTSWDCRKCSLRTFNSWSWQAIRTALHCRALLEWMYRKWTRTLINRKERASLWETNMHVKPLDIERQWRRCYFPRQGSTTLFTRLNLNGQILLSHG